MTDKTDNLSEEAQNRSQSESKNSNSLTTSKIIAAVITILIGLAAAGWGAYAVVQQQSQTPEHLMNQCKNSIKRIENNLSKHAA